MRKFEGEFRREYTVTLMSGEEVEAVLIGELEAEELRTRDDPGSAAQFNIEFIIVDGQDRYHEVSAEELAGLEEFMLIEVTEELAGLEDQY